MLCKIQSISHYWDAQTHKTIYKQKEKLFTETACNSLVSALRPDTCFRAFQVAEFYW